MSAAKNIFPASATQNETAPRPTCEGAGITADPEPSFAERVVAEVGRAPEAVLPILQSIQRHYGYLPEAVLRRVCDLTEITPAQIVEVATFYQQFRHRPLGRYRVRVCRGTACHVKGAEGIRDSIAAHLQIPDGGDTDPERNFTLEDVFCLGCCTLAPVIQIEDAIYGHLTYDTAPEVLRDFQQLQGAVPGRPPSLALTDKRAGEIRICLDSCCIARGCGAVRDALVEAIVQTGVQVKIKPVGCVVMCDMTPLLEVIVPGDAPIQYARVQSDDVKAIVQLHFKPRSVVRRIRNAVSNALDYLAIDNGRRPIHRYPSSVRDPAVTAFLGRQKHIALEHYGRLDPLDLDAYIAHGGFQALDQCLKERSPESVVDEIQKSGLRGRGGAGFPTGKKWAVVREAPGNQKYIIGNGDEGDPGAFMDRMLMESFPYRVIEGMAIAAHTVGANEGYVYIRAEYPFAVQRMREAIGRCERNNLLGEDIPGTGSALKLQVREGAGAFVCGEETALIESLEGRRPIPRLKPPFPAQRGLWGAPTLVNNVETYALVPWILRRGAKTFAELGTETSAGTKVFALAGKVVHGGLIEVPMGITIREIVEEIGGGVPEGKRFKAVQIGGPSGACVPASLAHTPMDYDALRDLGVPMGSGGLIVLDESDCMVDVARYFLAFTQNESCGQCTSCRVGTLRMLEILTRLCEGQGKRGDLAKLERLSSFTAQGSICGLGRMAPNPVLSTLRYFRDEYEAHLEGRCPAGKCKKLITYSVNAECTGCTICAQHCPTEAIPVTPFTQHAIDPSTCTQCDTCRLVCPVNAIEVR